MFSRRNKSMPEKDEWDKAYLKFRIRFTDVDEKHIDQLPGEPEREAMALRKELDKQINFTLKKLDEKDKKILNDKTRLINKMMRDESMQLYQTITRLREVLGHGAERIQRAEVEGRAELMHLTQAHLDYLPRAAMELGAMQQELLEGTDGGIGLVGADFSTAQTAAQHMREQSDGCRSACSSRCESLHSDSFDSTPRTPTDRV